MMKNEKMMKMAETLKARAEAARKKAIEEGREIPAIRISNPLLEKLKTMAAAQGKELKPQRLKVKMFDNNKFVERLKNQKTNKEGIK